MIFGSLFFFIFLRIIPQIHIIYDFWLLREVSLSRKFEVIYDYSFGEFSVWHLFDTTISILLVIATMVNVIVLMHYFRRQKKALNKGSLFATTTGMLFGVFGVGCVSCGALVLAPILSSFGLLGALELLPFAGRELVVIGLLAVIGSTIYLLSKLLRSLVC